MASVAHRGGCRRSRGMDGGRAGPGQPRPAPRAAGRRLSGRPPAGRHPLAVQRGRHPGYGFHRGDPGHRCAAAAAPVPAPGAARLDRHRSYRRRHRGLQRRRVPRFRHRQPGPAASRLCAQGPAAEHAAADAQQRPHLAAVRRGGGGSGRSHRQRAAGRRGHVHRGRPASARAEGETLLAALRETGWPGR